MTKEVIKKLPPLYANEKKAPNEVPVVVKFFTPWSNWSWFATEGELTEDGDWLFFGMVHGHEKELGYFVLSELAALKGPWGLKVERDMHYSGKTLADVMPA